MFWRNSFQSMWCERVLTLFMRLGSVKIEYSIKFSSQVGFGVKNILKSRVIFLTSSPGIFFLTSIFLYISIYLFTSIFYFMIFFISVDFISYFIFFHYEYLYGYFYSAVCNYFLYYGVHFLFYFILLHCILCFSLNIRF